MNLEWLLLNGPDIAVQVFDFTLNCPEVDFTCLFLDTQSNYGACTHRSKAEMGDRTGLCGAVLMEIESRHNSTFTCPVKSREGKISRYS